MKRSNYICLGISLVPFLFAITFRNRIIDNPSTHLFGSSPATTTDINKQGFILIILVCGIMFYLLSFVVTKYLPYISTKLNLMYSRFFINAVLALLIFVLVLENLK